MSPREPGSVLVKGRKRKSGGTKTSEKNTFDRKVEPDGGLFFAEYVVAERKEVSSPSVDEGLDSSPGERPRAKEKTERR